MRRGIVFLLGVLAAAQTPTEPTFRTGTELVQVSVVAQDKDGKPIADLRREDFQIFDNSRQQDIRLFLVQKPEAAGPGVTPPGIFTNRVATDRPTAWSILLFDNLNLDPSNSQFEHTARAQTKALAALRAIPPGDEIAIYALWCRFQVVREFTTDRDSILTQLGRFAAAPGGCMTPPSAADQAQSHSVFEHQRDPNYGQKALDAINVPPTTAEFGMGHKAPEPTLTSATSEADMAEAASKILAAIGDAEVSQLADHLAGIPGRKNLIWLTTAFHLSPSNLRKLINAGVTIYPVDTLGSTIALKTFKDERAAQMAQFAAATGGKYYTDRDDLDVAIEDAMNDGRVSYLLGFYRPDQSQASQHQIAVRVNRPGVTLRYRTSYTVEAPPAKPSDPVRDVVLAMNRPVDATAIGMWASVTRAGATRLNVAVAFDVSNLDLEQEQGLWTGKAEFVARFVTADDKQAGGATARTMTFHLKPTTYATALQRGYLFREQLTIPPKAVELNLAMSNLATGKIGTIRIPLSQVK